MVRSKTLPVCLPVCLPARLPARLPVCLPARLPARLPVCLPARLPARLPVSLPVCLPVCIPVCLESFTKVVNWPPVQGIFKHVKFKCLPLYWLYLLLFPRITFVPLDYFITILHPQGATALQRSFFISNGCRYNNHVCVCVQHMSLADSAAIAHFHSK